MSGHGRPTPCGPAAVKSSTWPGAQALVWTATGWDAGYQPSDLARVLEANPDIRWVQLPWAGVEPYAAAGVIDSGHVWTCGKGVYAEPVAEHALALALAGLHHLKSYSEARSWTAQAGSSLAAAASVSSAAAASARR